MGLISALFGTSSPESSEFDELERKYGPNLIAGMGLTRSDVRKLIVVASEEAAQIGDSLPKGFGDELLKGKTEGQRAYLKERRAEGVTDDDIRWYFGISGTERQLLVKISELGRMAMFMHFRQEGMDISQATTKMHRFHPLFGDPADSSIACGEDRPLYFELYARVNAFTLRRAASDPAGIKVYQEAASSFNAIVRRAIRDGSL